MIARLDDELEWKEAAGCAAKLRREFNEGCDRLRGEKSEPRRTVLTPASLCEDSRPAVDDRLQRGPARRECPAALLITLQAEGYVYCQGSIPRLDQLKEW
jgi:hypothetical protein